ncbi:hypothetical protein HIM_06864 [Hirsutella minnesotensis 3608]|uniref:Laccase-1 n=1 Tax=Hirsutella minnesotensis 3608 TaxID=1043627 RepID=A0A0F7ZIJ0_9HYPO|nr:hypothetical protein HIM_06864 [Hirsutella minnesotensis 3608]
MLPKVVSAVAWAAVVPLSLGLTSPLAPVNGPRRFDLTVTWEEHAPDGLSRDMILINGEFPGPVLEMNEGEEAWVAVHNRMPFNTTMHYHGIEMSDTPWSDGVPGVSQREIPPGESFTYKWTATQCGEYWYHAHHRGQVEDGQFGAIIIHPREDRSTPFGLISRDERTIQAIEEAVAAVRPLMLSDWRHMTSAEAWDVEVRSNMEIPCYDSLLINGQGKVDCLPAKKMASLLSPAQKKLLKIGGASAMTPKGCLPKEVQAKVIAGGRPTNVSAIPPDVFDVCTPTQGSNAVVQVHRDEHDDSGTWVALEIVGAYSTLTTAFSIDRLPMWVYAVDGEYIEPQHVNAISITNGDRYSVLVHLKEPGDYTIRHACTFPVQILSGQATLSYRVKHEYPAVRRSTPYINDVGMPVSADVVFFNHTAQRGYPARPVGQRAHQTFILDMGITGAAYQWGLNGTSRPPSVDANDPVLFKPQPNALNNLTITTRNGTWVDLVFVAAQPPQPPHPIHKHGNKMWLIGAGHAPWKWKSVDEAVRDVPQSFNLVDPPRRDGFATLDAPKEPSWTAVRYHVTNPGAWLLHCHVQTHLEGGMSMVIQDGIDRWPTVPPEYLHYGE